MKRRLLVLGIILATLIAGALLVAGCSAADPITETVYTSDLFPAETNTYSLGSSALTWLAGHFTSLFVGGVENPWEAYGLPDQAGHGGEYLSTNGTLAAWAAVAGGGDMTTAVYDPDVDGVILLAQLDPLIVPSQWVTDANGITYTLGSIGVNTPSVAAALLKLYSNNGVANNPVLYVGENSASVGAQGINVNMAGAKTGDTSGIYIANAATSGTAGINKYGLYIRNTSVWNGVGSINYGLYVEQPTGGTVNVAAYIDGDSAIDGTLDMGAHRINNVDDPANPQDAATKYYVDSMGKTVTGSLTAGNANAIGFAWHNPEAQDIFIKRIVIEVTTAGGTVGSHLDVGIADDVVGTNRGTEFFTGLLLNSVQVNDDWKAADGGNQTKWVVCQDSVSATDGWVVGQILDANAAGLVGKYYIEYIGR